MPRGDSTEAHDTFSEREQVRREIEHLFHVTDFLNAGLAVRKAGLIYFLPLCHDAYGGNY